MANFVLITKSIPKKTAEFTLRPMLKMVVVRENTQNIKAKSKILKDTKKQET
jgi:hypothetical protein